MLWVEWRKCVKLFNEKEDTKEPSPVKETDTIVFMSLQERTKCSEAESPKLQSPGMKSEGGKGGNRQSNRAWGMAWPDHNDKGAVYTIVLPTWGELVSDLAWGKARGHEVEEEEEGLKGQLRETEAHREG